MAFSMSYVLTGLFWLGFALLALGVLRRASLWRQGQAAVVSWSGLLAMPKRYFVDVHHVVVREPSVAQAHVAVAGGGVAILLLAALNYGLMLHHWLLDALLVLMGLMMLMGARQMRLRRQNAPSRLSQGLWQSLPGRLGWFALGVGIVMLCQLFLPSVNQATAQLIALLGIALLCLGGAELALGISLGRPMKHAVAGLLHLAFHPRAERFHSKSSGLTLLNLEAAEYGVAKPSDFAWNRLLSFDACVQCGKCEAACPAFAAGQPLNPKKLIQDMVVSFAKDDPAYAGSQHPGIAERRAQANQNIVGGILAEETLWSCTTCRACVENCPMLIEHVDTVISLRRHQTLVAGKVPGKGPEALANLRHTDTVGGYPLAARYHWATDLAIPTLQVGQSTDYLLIAGEGAFDMRYQRALRALVTVLKAAGVKLAVLGAAELDCGDVARRLGDEAGFQRLAQANIALLAQYAFKTIVTPDPHVFHCLKNEYPALGGHYAVQHHSQLLEQLLKQGAIPLREPTEQSAITFHDPCYLGRYNDGYAAPRNVLKGIGIKVIEMERSERNARCCGWGGGAAFTDMVGERRIPDMRMEDIQQTGASRVAVACPNCTAMLEGVVGPRPEVVELAELLAEQLKEHAHD